MPIFKHHSYFSVTSHVINDVNVREGNVKNRHTGNQYWSDVNSGLTGKRELHLKIMDVKCMLVNRLS